MKKLLLLLAICSIGLSFNGFAQKARVGVSGGFTLANMNGLTNGVQTTGDFLTGAVVGLYVDAPFAKHFTFLPGIYYVQKGMKVKSSGPAAVSYNLRYADANLNVVYTTNIKRVKFFTGAGPSFGLNVPSKKVTKIGSSKTYTDITFGNTGSEDFKGLDLGANFLVGIRLPCGGTLSVNYTQGFKNLSYATGKTIYNNYVGVQLGFLFHN